MQYQRIEKFRQELFPGLKKSRVSSRTNIENLWSGIYL
ncbi:Uncharacterized protein dnm_044850 [Desulfonema magnum]|uniref:Uncharacterized protein n=1 Tax=Desulfonema magnum TaxID=45655 RepID=A0A975GP43_9BACT|nr:Uncharacterized protein dnm_044850 [Desulfonema magnum]